MAVLLYPAAGLILWAFLAYIHPAKYDSFKQMVMTVSIAVIFLCILQSLTERMYG